MEKYRQFEDQSNGINPFTNASKKTKSLFLRLISLPLTGCKFIIIILTFLALSISRLFLQLIFIKRLHRFLEVLLSRIAACVILFLLGIWSFPYKFKRHDKKRIPNIIISSQSSIIDWLVLLYNYTPKFLYLVKSTDNKDDYWIEVSYCSLISYGCGLQHRHHSTKDSRFNIEKYISQPNQIPLVIFPEGSKTNRQGILSIRSNIMNDWYDCINDHERVLIRSEIIVNKNRDFNTTDRAGYCSLFALSERFKTDIEIYSQDIPNDIFRAKDAKYDTGKYKTVQSYIDANVQEYLMEPLHRNVVSWGAKDHEKFWEYFWMTNADKNASYVRKDN